MIPSLKVASAHTVAAEVTSHMETAPVMTISTEVTAIDTLTPSGNAKLQQSIFHIRFLLSLALKLFRRNFSTEYSH